MLSEMLYKFKHAVSLKQAHKNAEEKSPDVSSYELKFNFLKNSSAKLEVALPIAAGLNVVAYTYLALAGGSIYHATAAEVNAYMTAKHNYVAALQTVKVILTLVLSARTPAGRSHIALAHAGFVQSPIYETGAVERIRTLRAQYILAS